MEAQHVIRCAHGFYLQRIHACHPIFTAVPQDAARYPAHQAKALATRLKQAGYARPTATPLHEVLQ